MPDFLTKEMLCVGANGQAYLTINPQTMCDPIIPQDTTPMFALCLILIVIFGYSTVSKLFRRRR